MDNNLRNRRIRPETIEEREAFARIYGQHAPKLEELRPDSFYPCQLCAVARAEWPREKQHTFRFPFGYAWTVAYITPMVCSNCRIMRQPEVTRLGDGRRRFLKRVIALWLGKPYPSAGPKMRRALIYRALLVKHPDPMSLFVILTCEWKIRHPRGNHHDAS